MNDDYKRNPHEHPELRLHMKRAWLNGQIEKAMRKRRYPGLLWEDSLPLWVKVLAEAAGLIVLVVLMFLFYAAAMWVGQIT